MLGLEERVRAKEHRGCCGAEVRHFTVIFYVDIRMLAAYPSLFAYRRNIGRDINTLLIINEVRRTAPRNHHWAHSIAIAI